MTLRVSSYIPRKTMGILTALKVKKVPVEWNWDGRGKVKLGVPRGTMRALGYRKQDLPYLETELTNLVKRSKILALDLQAVASLFGEDCRRTLAEGLEKAKVK